MQTGIKDGRVTLMLTYEEWMEMSDIIHYATDIGENTNRGAARSQIDATILEATNKLDAVFCDLLQKELNKVPEYLKMIIRETPTEIPPKKEAIT